MIELSQRARRVIEEARLADRPSSADKRRIRDKLVARLGAGALVTGAVVGSSATGAAGGAGAAGSSSAGSAFGSVATGAASGAGATAGAAGAASGAGAGVAVGLTTKITLVSAVIGAIGIGAATTPWESLTTSKTEQKKTNSTVTAQPTPKRTADLEHKALRSTTDSPSVETHEANLETLSSDSAKQRRIRKNGSEAISPQLKAELKLLRAAQLALQQGDSTGALAELNSHRRQFPRGLLQQEREAARAVALCELGRLEQGRQVAQRLLSMSPRSPLAQRIRRSCDR
ncbi:MAG: hypothetical protein JXA30_20605 [Deltaproteobacteria bacterium]|nr:hypothetical protein [Deltaproteobacteria bacterium]